MNIKCFNIYGLFNQFNHEIELRKDIKIIIGKNGVGKTSCLELLYSLFNGRWSTLFTIPYKNIGVLFKDGEVWDVVQKKSTIEIKSSKSDNPYIIEKEKWYDDDRFISINGRVFDRTRNIMYSENSFRTRFSGKGRGNAPDWFENKTKENKVKIIKSQRLIEYQFDGGDIDEFYGSPKLQSQNIALKNAKDLAIQIKDIVSEASDIANRLDKSFPTRLLNNKIDKFEDSDELKRELDKLGDKRKDLSDIGLLLSEKEVSDLQVESINKDSFNVLNLYIQDSWEKLKPYDKIAKRLKLFETIINKRFLFKKIVMSKEEGYYFEQVKSRKKDRIPIEKLSSGEQNELVMFYNLLFECNESDLILIDEPEISLHVEWLNTMLSDLIDISESNGLAMLIATHSPDFIGREWSLTTELK